MRKTFVFKQDLAVSYFPNIDTESARHKFSNLIHEDKALFRKLVRSGYKKTAKQLSPSQVNMIFERLGNPYS